LKLDIAKRIENNLFSKVSSCPIEYSLNLPDSLIFQ
jgi:hypothetical protein